MFGKDKTPALIIRVLGADGEPLGGKVDVVVRHRRLDEGDEVRGADASEDIVVEKLRRAPEGDYRVTVTRRGEKRSQSKFVTIPEQGTATASFVFRETAGADARIMGAVFEAAAPPDIYFVAGIVASPDRAGVGGLRVDIVDKGVGPDFSFTRAITNERGEYEAQVTAEQVRNRGKLRPDLQARVYREETFLGASEVRYDAGAREMLNVLLTARADALPAEYETLTSAIGQHYHGPLGELKEDDDRQDVGYLANKTGWDARAVALASLADQFTRSTDSGITEPFFYALFRAGVPANNDALFTAGARAVERIWSQALEQGVIPESLAVDLPRAVESYIRASGQRMLTAQPAVGPSPLRDLLGAARIPGQQHETIAALYSQHQDDLPRFYAAVSSRFDSATAQRLKTGGQLAFVTINNAPLVTRVNEAIGGGEPVNLARQGFHRAAQWRPLLTGDIPVPKEIPGADEETRRNNYAQYLASHVRLSYPTAAVANMVANGDLRVTEREGVRAFLDANQGRFEIGMQPVEAFLRDNHMNIDPKIVADVKRIQRVYQITPRDEAMSELLQNGLDSAHAITRYAKETFVARFGGRMGGADIAAATWDRSLRIHNAVLNLTVSFLSAKNGVILGDPDLSADIIDPAPKPADPNAILAYPTLESLFGSMDFCACDHCRSVLSPAAYLVDLLQFIDDPTPDAGKKNPQTVLLGRRPDLEHLPLTCENTNTALPYIDVVNEVLEYYVAHQRSLANYAGHDTGTARSEDLLAAPQYVTDAAYTELAGKYFPPPLPFHQSLESLRQYYEKLEVPLPLAMERLVKSDALERGGNAYGWRDILMEDLRLSRAEYDLLTTSVALWEAYGFKTNTTEANVVAALVNAKVYALRAGITYEELVALLRTRFVNPNSDLLPRLERLGVSFLNIDKLKKGQLSDADFLKLLPQGAGAIPAADYGGDIAGWAKTNHPRIVKLITLSQVKATETCDFSAFELRFAQPPADASDLSTRIGAVELVRLLRFIRLWKKTGWTIEQTDAAMVAFYRDDRQPLTAADVEDVTKLNTGFSRLLPRLGFAVRTLKALELTPERHLLPLLAVWSPIGTHGKGALYAGMFLNPALLARDPDFAANVNGEYLADGAKKLAPHAETIRTAFGLTGEEYARIVAALQFDGDTVLSLANVSAIYRRGWLARKLRISVRELLLLVERSGLDPFAAPDVGTPALPPMLRLIAFVRASQERSIKPATAAYLLWNEDISGRSAPEPASIEELLRTLRADFAAIDAQFAAVEDPAGDVARARIALVYGEAVAAALFALFDETLIVDAAYTHGTPALDPAITAQDPNIAYDHFAKRLSYRGVLDTVERDNLKNVGGVSPDFKNAVDALFARSEDAKRTLFTRHPELEAHYNAWAASNKPPAEKRAALLAALRPELVRRRKRQQAAQRLSAASSTDLAFVTALLDAPAAPFPLHAAGQTGKPALDDAVAVDNSGLAVQFFNSVTATGTVSSSVAASGILDYAPGSNPLPSLVPLSAIWIGRLEAPEDGFTNFIIDTDAVSVTLTIGGVARPLTRTGTAWRNTQPIELRAGTFHEVELKVENVKGRLRLDWETAKRARETVPARYLYPPSIAAPFTAVVVRLLKTATLAEALRVTAKELAHLTTHADTHINGQGWLNALPVSGSLSGSPASALSEGFRVLLDFAAWKAELSPNDEQLLAVLKDPVAASTAPSTLLYSVTRWDQAAVQALAGHFGTTVAGLARPATFGRVRDAHAIVRQMGIAAADLLAATTNNPATATVIALQGALRARYDAGAWREIVQPINDRMRALGRDALVAWILHAFRLDNSPVDTPEKLFEYFLMDVQMEPCMQTSRIRHALSSVQLFIERCLMNLEIDVSPTSINAKQWEWMKRYRVWEANRKVFLFPENWLEPELRDDKSPFFKEIESELLQSDVTEESATTAVLNYLAKLDEVARLEPCGIHHVVPDPTLRKGAIDHVIARTSGANRKYFYRRREYGYWTPWEPVKLELEDNPILPVVWKDRLLLFWLRMMKEGPATSNKGTAAPGTPLTSLTTNDVPSDPAVRRTLTLCWSEYYNGKWQAARTSDIDLPEELKTSSARRELALRADLEGTALRINIEHVQSLSAGDLGSFLLHNTHSLPIRGKDATPPGTWPPGSRTVVGTGGTFWYFDYKSIILSPYGPIPNHERQVLKKPGIKLSWVKPRHGLKLQDTWDAPMFLYDPRHVFYITTEEQWVPVYDFDDIWTIYPPKLDPKIPDVVLVDQSHIFKPPKPWQNGNPVHDPGYVDPVPFQELLSEDVYIRQGLGTSGSVRFGNVSIGPSGAIDKNINRP
jgi:hypothetical protein